jgi:RHS repeat-associated protein
LGTAQLDEWGNVVQNTLPEVLNNYTNHEYDAVLGVYYAKARFYDPGNSRMMSVDPIKGNLTNSQSLTAYIYVQNNPLKYIDPSGTTIANIKTRDREAYKYHGDSTSMEFPVDTSDVKSVANLMDKLNGEIQIISDNRISSYNYKTRFYTEVEIGAEKTVADILNKLGFSSNFDSNAFYTYFGIEDGKCQYFVYAEDTIAHRSSGKIEFPELVSIAEMGGFWMLFGLLNDKEAYTIVSNYLWGTGKDLIIRNDDSWDNLITNTDLFKYHVLSSVQSALTKDEANFSFTTLNRKSDDASRNFTISEPKNYIIGESSGGYFSAEDLINGVNNDFGGLNYSGKIIKTNEGIYIKGEYSLNDYVDPNSKYRSDVILSYLIPGTDYRLNINGKFFYLLDEIWLFE